MGLFNRTGFSKGDKVFIPWMLRSGKITQIRGGLIRINVINPGPSQPKEIMAKPGEIRKAK